MNVEAKTKPQGIVIQVCDEVTIKLSAVEARELFRDLDSSYGCAASRLWDELGRLFGPNGEFK